MRLLNRDRYVLRLPCDRLTALGTLRSHTSNKTLSSRGVDRYFSVTLVEDEFRLMPLISGRNSWLPVLRGTITEEADGTCRVEIDARPGLFTRVFMAIWYGFLGVVSAIGAITLCLTPEENGAWVIFPAACVILLIGFLISHFAFWIPARKAKQTLLDIWNGEEIR